MKKKKVLPKIDLPFLTNYVKRYLKETRFEWLIQGNLLKDEAINIAETCHKILRDEVLTLDRTPTYRIANIQTRTNYVYCLDSKDEANVNSSLLSCFQVGKLDHVDLLKLEIINSIFKEKFFNDLRTKQALGYIVSMFPNKVRKVCSLNYVVQSSVKSPEYIWQKITEFVIAGEQIISELNDKTFNIHIASITNELKKKDLKLSDEANRNYFQIKNREFLFNIKELNLELISTIKKEEVIAFYKEHFIKNFKRLDVEVICKTHKAENEVLLEVNNEIAAKNYFKRIKVSSINDFKKKVPLYEDFMF